MTSDESTKLKNTKQQGKESVKEPDALTQCLFSQNMFTIGSVAGTTAYTVLQRPKNGLGLSFVMGAAGTMCDLAYGWTVACQSHVQKQKEERDRKFNNKFLQQTESSSSPQPPSSSSSPAAEN